MKTRLILTCLALAASAVPALAGSDQLVASMRKQQRAAEKRIVRLWATKERGEKMETTLSAYVVRELRLRSIMGKADGQSLLNNLLTDGKPQYDNPQALAQALVREYYIRQGFAAAGKEMVDGDYLISNADVEIEPEPEAKDE